MTENCEYHGYLDRFSILDRAVIFSGWTNRMDIDLYYDDHRLSPSLAKVQRPDLVSAFGPDATNWGFFGCASLPSDRVDRSKFRLRLNSGITDCDIGIFSAAEDLMFTDMLESFRRNVSAKKPTSLLEIGSRARSGNAYRSWFPQDVDYVGMDVMAGPNVDVIGDAHRLSRVVDRSFDFIFSMAVFEHILMPWKVALEMNKVLNEGGRALIISHGAWPLHEEPWDFFRFSKESWRGIFNVHTGFRLIDAQYQYPASIVPTYTSDSHFENMSKGRTYLLSGCVVEKISDAKVEWNAETDEVYNLEYSHS